MLHASLGGVTAPQQRKGVATKNRRGKNTLEKRNSAANGRIFIILFFSSLRHGTATAPHRDMAATGIATHNSTVKDRERAWDGGERDRKTRWNVSPRARRGKPLAYPRKASHVTWPQQGSQLTTRQSQTGLVNRGVVYTRRGGAATSFKELLQRQKQGKRCTNFFPDNKTSQRQDNNRN